MIDSYNENNKMNSSNIFFKPYVGTFYNEGINGKKVLVLGASFYCGMSQCIYYKDCTNENIKDSSPYDDICPYYDVALHNAPSTENGTAYSKFTNSIAKALDINQDRFWDFVSFTNYIQFFLPHWQTFMEDCSDRDAKALIERRKNFSNKGDYGYVGIMGGSRLYPGAIKLASLAQNSLYAGCGVSRIIVPDIISDKLYPYVLEATIYPLKSNGNSFIFDEIELKKAINRLNCLSIGVGISLDKEIELILEYLILIT